MYELGWYQNVFKQIASEDIMNPNNMADVLDLLKNMQAEHDFNDVKVKETAMKMSNYARKMADYMAQTTGEEIYNDLYWKFRLFEAPWQFESYMYYLEKNRRPEKRFYEPREDTLKIVANDLQDLEDSRIKFYGLSMPARVGKSSICVFFISWIMGKRPDSHNAMGGHSGILAEGFHGELLNIITGKDYTYNEIFPDVVLEKKSADKLEINLNSPDRFSTMTCRGVDGTWTGAVDISSDGYLYTDDMVRDRQESLSQSRLESKFQQYQNVMVDRKNDGARELMVGTRWNVYDPLGRMEAIYKNNPLYRFRKIPALNENGESNFNYKYGKGFSTQYYIDLRDRLDANEWMAKYQQRPFVREGIMFPADELRYYNGILPEGGFVGNIAACDVAWGGGDSLSMPIGALYENGDCYIYDWVFSKEAKESTLPMVVGRIIGNEIQSINFEANNGGDMYEYYVKARLEIHNYSCKTTSSNAPGRMAKKEKINQYSGDVIKNFIFLDDHHRSAEYQEAMDEFTTFTYLGDNEHDDAPDGITQLAMKIYGKPAREAEIIEVQY